ncbi:MAG TPA: 3-oxoadipate enol-lactonase [Acidobacteriaceae bacterium]
MRLESNGISIQYDFHGPASAPVIVFSHSLGASLAMWRPQLEAFAKSHRVLLCDTRGHGGSSSGSGPATAETLGNDLLGLLDLFSIDRIHFCGLSMGGVIGQWLGVHAPQRLHSLVLANTAAKIGTNESWNTRIAAVERDGLGPLIPGTLERWFTAAFRASHPETVAGIEAILRRTEPAGYLACCAAIRDADFRETACTITVPTLLLAGLHDPTTTCTDMRSLANAISGSRYVELDAAHLSNVEAASAFNEALQAFLAQLPKR